MDEADLHALVDGELTPQRRREVEDHLLQHKEDAALVENWRRQNAALRSAFESVAREIPPLSLRNAAARNAAAGPPSIETGAIHWGRPGGSFRPPRRLDEARGERRRRSLVAGAAVLIAVASLAGAGVFVAPQLLSSQSAPHSDPSPQGYVDRAGIAYSTFAHETRPVEYDAARKSELLALLVARTGFAYAPDLSNVGLRLLGGRLTPGLWRPAGLLIYETAGGERVALYFERAEAEPAASAPPRADQGLTAIEWRGAGMAFVLIGPLPVERLKAGAERAAFDIVTPFAPSGAARP
jgi:anti-sigma factor RsiW